MAPLDISPFPSLPPPPPFCLSAQEGQRQGQGEAAGWAGQRPLGSPNSSPSNPSYSVGKPLQVNLLHTLGHRQWS